MIPNLPLHEGLYTLLTEFALSPSTLCCAEGSCELVEARLLVGGPHWQRPIN